jgi:hypothetical protein
VLWGVDHQLNASEALFGIKHTNKGEYGNIEVDLLAKKGIGSNCYKCQIINIPI